MFGLIGSRRILVNECLHVNFLIELGNTVAANGGLLSCQIVITSDESQKCFLRHEAGMAVFECQRLKVDDVLDSNAHSILLI